MKAKYLTLCCAALFQASLATADTVIEQQVDTLPGKSTGALAGFMVGATAGPIGALAGAAVGALSGMAVQESTGLGERAYRVERDDGSERVVRSPSRSWSVNDKVSIRDGRLVAQQTAP